MALRRNHNPNIHPADADAIVVGAGIAGLYAAWRLQRAGYSVIVFEAEAGAGGRVKSRREKQTQLGLTIDDGANLINSTDTLALRLMDSFGIRYVRRVKRGMDSMNYLVRGVLYDQQEFDRLIFDESRSAINAMLADQDFWRSDVERDTNPRFIDESIAAYLKRIEAGPILRSILNSFFWSEYGHEIGNLNLHVLFDYLKIDLQSPYFKLIHNVDEAYTVPHGVAQITARMEKEIHAQVLYGAAVARISQENDRVIVEANSKDGALRRSARHLFFAAPLHRLKDIKVEVEGLSQHAIDEAGIASYADGTKLHLKFEPGFHERYRYAGIVLTDTGEQIWPSSTGQGGAGLLTVLTGPLPPGRAAAVVMAGQVLMALDRVLPDLSDLYVGVERSDAPMSYSGSLRPGELAHLAIHEGAARWTTIGEASGGPLQGYLEGALRSADAGVSRYILSRRKARG
jgi:monoamine oxidase